MNADALGLIRRGRHDVAATVTKGRQRSQSLAVKLHWALRIGVALEFIGHGMAGFYRPVAWIPYFTFFGIPETFAYDHMTYITGTIDIALGILVLVRPMRAVMLHMAGWGLMTAWLRPLTGESFFELVERGANYGMPLALLVLSGWGGRSLRSWFECVRPPEEIGEELARRLGWIVRASIALLLVGHGGLGIWAAKEEWFDFLEWFGITQASEAARLMQWVGAFEVVLGLAVLIKPLRGLLLFVLAWKVGTELLRPLVGQPNYQFVERAGDYVLPLALFWLTRYALQQFGVEHTTAALAGAPPTPYSLWVTTIFRREDGDWKIVHRHGDPYDASAGGAGLPTPGFRYALAHGTDGPGVDESGHLTCSVRSERTTTAPKAVRA